MSELRHVESEGRRHLFAFNCPCGRLSRFAAEADTVDAARVSLLPQAAKHIAKERQ